MGDLSHLSSSLMLGRKTGSAGGLRARNFLLLRFEDLGLAYFPEYHGYIQTFPLAKSSSAKQGYNVIGWLQGSKFDKQFIVVTAHYDHLGQKGRHIFHGADDNASGVAALLTLARQVAMVGLAHSVIFVATDAEERGLQGAKAFIKDLPVNKEDILLNLNLDMLGEGGSKNRLYVTTTKGDKQLMRMVKNIAVSAGLCFIHGHSKSQRFTRASRKVNWRKASDHAAFARIDIPYLFVGGGTHERYHTPKDTFERIDKEFYTSAVETAWLLLQAADSYSIN